MSTIKIINLLLISSSVTFGLIFLSLYLLRKNYKEELYNLLFACQSLTSAFWGIVFTPFSENFLKLVNLNIDYRPLIQTVTIALFLFLIIQSFFVILHYTKEEKKIFIISYLLFLLAVPFAAASIFMGYDNYINSLYIIVVACFAIGMIYYIILFIITIIKYRKYNVPNFFWFIFGFIVFLVVLTIDQTISIFVALSGFEGSFILSASINYILLALILIKFTDEFKELNEYKKDLDKKINERTKELEFANIKLKEDNQKRINFFNNINHELKTPLTIASINLDKHIKIYGTSEHLDLTKIQMNGIIKTTSTTFDVEKLSRKGDEIIYVEEIFCISNMLKEKVVQFSDIAEKKKIKIISNIEENIFCKSDSFNLGKVFNNLIDNAIKYTNNGGEIFIKLIAGEKNIIEIQDTGIGISNDNLSHIYKPYYQVERKKLNSQGMGMGLYIVKEIITGLKGKITEKSTINKGTIFSIEINRYFPSNNENISNYSHTMPIDDLYQIENKEVNILLNKENILVVEDHPAMLKLIQESLYNEYNVFISTNGQEAIEKLKNIPMPDLIISDIMMDTMDGKEFRRVIMNDINYKNIPFLFLTAIDEENEIYECFNDLEADDYIIKPFNELDLINKSYALIRRKKERDQLNDKIKILLNKNHISFEQNFQRLCNENKIDFRTRDMIIMMINGKTNKEIASEFGMSESGIKDVVSRIYKSFFVKNRIELIKVFTDQIKVL